MNKYLLSILLVIFAINFTIAQDFNKDTLVGNWVVVQVMTSSNNLPKDVKQMMEVMKKGYKDSKFTFKSNGKFTIEFQKDAPAFMNELKFLNNKDWKYNENEKLISVGTKDDNYNHLRMYVKRQGDKIFFAFNDTPLILEMKRL